MAKKAILMIFTLIFSTNAISSEIVASIKPLHSLVSSVTQGSDSVSLLIKGSMSPHNFALKPSHAKLLNNAKIVFYIDNQFESALKKTVIGLPTRVRVVKVSSTKQLKLLPTRAGDNWEEDGHDHHHHDHGSNDLHFWLEPNNAIQIVKGIVRELSIVYPDNINLYKKNAKKIIKEIKSVDLSIKSILEPVKNKPFIVFHDAYQYFENKYGLNAVGSILLDPEIPPSPKRIIQIRAKIKTTNPTCVFKEPQFRAKIVNTVIEDTNVKVGILDPVGADLEEGPGMYTNLLKQIASNLKTCLN
jgi:zinc transport system substrate-binding protein